MIGSPYGSFEKHCSAKYERTTDINGFISFTDINFYIFCFFALRLLGIIKINAIAIAAAIEVSNAVRNNGLIALSFIAPTGGNETNTENDAKVRAEVFLDSILEITLYKPS